MKIKRSIKSKLFMFFLAFMMSLVLGGIFLNAVFLEKFYIYKNKETFQLAAERIQRIAETDPRGLQPYIDQFDRSEGTNCTITDRDLRIRMNSFPQKAGPNADRLPVEIEKQLPKDPSLWKNDSYYTVIERVNDQAPKMVFFFKMKNGDYLILKKSISGITESVAIANQFYLFTGLLLIGIGSISLYGFSKRLTDPIIEMSHVAEALSALDFENRAGYKAKDEIGTLANSINQMAEKLKESLSDLEKDVERRKILVRNLSHELKTPIGVIKGYAEGLKYGVITGEEKQQRYYDVISAECDRMDGMIRELLELSQLESGSLKLEYAQIGIKGLLTDLVERFGTAGETAGIHWKVECPEDLMLIGDREWIFRALTNYVTNGLHHIAGEKLLCLKAEMEEKTVRITVRNTGSPIPNSELESIWDVFYKTDKARTREYGGHGIGLSIVRLVAELHHGNAGINNLEDGVEFFIEIPKVIRE